MEKSAYKTYIKEINKFPLLTAKEEKELSVCILNGDVTARQTLINANLRLVVQIACKFGKNEETVMDAIQEGNIGLLHAASRFDYSYNTRFSTYAYYWIHEYICRYKRHSDKDIHIPHKVQETMRLILSAQVFLSQKLDKEPTVKEIAVFTGISEQEINENLSFNYKFSSIECLNETGSEFSVLDILSDNRANPEIEVLEMLERNYFVDIINTLPEKERLVINQRYDGFKKGKKITYKTISQKTGTSIEGTRQIEIRANSKLQLLFKNYYSEVLNERVPI